MGSLPEKRVLVVDDDDAIRTLLFTVLRRRGFQVDTARHGAEALERYSKCRYALLLLDLMMPRMSGYEVLEEMERRTPDERPIIIVLTAGTEPRHLGSDLVTATLRKPFDIEVLADTISACLSTLDPRPQEPNCPPADSDPARKPPLSGPSN
jgi:DNA-binding response OmpR family regulator